MDIREFVSRLDGVKPSGNNYIALCPAHDDKKQSLSVSTGEEGQILVYCHAGCDTQEIVSAMGLSMSELFPNSKTEFSAIYEYRDADGVLLYQKMRRADKTFTQRTPDGKGGWIYNRKGIPPTLYNLPKVLKADTVYVAEGEKDADTLSTLDLVGTTSENGAGAGKWRKEYTEDLRGKTVYVLFDNDDIGRAYGEETAKALSGVAKSVKLLNLKSVYTQLPEHGDISDVTEAAGKEMTLQSLAILAENTPEYEPTDSFLSCFKTLDDFSEEEATWLIPGWIPEGQITLLAADGGIGKTTLWCSILTALSSGTSSILDPLTNTREPRLVAFLTTEDSVRKKLKKKLREAGANEKNIITPDFLADKDGLLRNLKFGSPDMAKFIRHFKPALCVFDPVQGFIPPELNMGSRNAMRDCMAPLITLGEECGTTFLVVCHTNKRKGAYGRDRIADSADLWDISRSVLMAGYTEEQGVRYLSNEKNNYSQLQETLLFNIDDNGQAQSVGSSWKRDREYTQDAAAAKTAPKREDCKEFILNALDEARGSMPSKELEEKAALEGYAFKTVRNAKDELKKDGKIKYLQTGSAKDKTWHVQRTFVELDNDESTPWDI